MPEEQGNTGERANRRLRALLKGFGWESKGGNVDISCETRRHDQEEHGIDGYMVYDDPYLSKERGVILESKSKKWENWTPQSVNDAAGQTLRALECSTRSEDFEEKLNYSKNRAIDAAILGAYTNDDGYNEERFQGYIESCDVRKGGGGPYHVLILDNNNLNRLASIQSKFLELKETHTKGNHIVDADLDYFYPSLHMPKAAPIRSNQLSFEYLFSDYIYAKLQKTEMDGHDVNTRNISIIFNSGEVSKNSLKFLYLSLRDNEVLDTEEVWVYSYMQTEEEEDTKYGQITDDLKQNLLPDEKEFKFMPLPRVDYKTFADDRRSD